MKPRKFKVEFTIVDNDPVGDSRDGQAILEILLREYGYDSYHISDYSVEEIADDNSSQRV